MKGKKILCLVIINGFLFSCAVLREVTCLNKQQLSSKEFMLSFQNQTLSPAGVQSFIRAKDSCVGLYIVTYKYQSSKLMLPVLKFNSGFTIYVDTADVKTNETRIEKFKLEYRSIFKPHEMREIEERFLKGKIYVGSN